MCIQPHPFYSLLILHFFLILSINLQPIHGFISSKKLDEPIPRHDSSVKCTPCTRYSPPPPPPPKKPPPIYCPPPPLPPSSFIYMLGPPVNLYPIEHDFASADRRSVAMELPVVAFFGLIGLIALL
ncbi:hypothetical protein Csa_004723 [Cucumis sativus]|uniref:Uncharacterized protein n=1 Tax=Cucumis sativus TaxID=3659 RepID=A0A0A0KSV7_CUCSA|nr:hypothetical protein Csa_004723 [Cucumis sativus]